MVLLPHLLVAMLPALLLSPLSPHLWAAQGHPLYMRLPPGTLQGEPAPVRGKSWGGKSQNTGHEVSGRERGIYIPTCKCPAR